MHKELHILILEDSPADAELEEYELRKAGLVFTSKVVDTREAFLKELDDFLPDLILSDYDLPSFDGLAALRIAKEKCPDVPFILVTGKLGEEFAIEKLKEGAADYVLKSNLKRLVPSVTRALEEAKLIVERKQVEKALQQSEERYRKQFDEAIDAIFLADLGTGMVLDCNTAASKLLEREKSEIVGKHQSFIHPAGYIKDGVSKTFKRHMNGEPSDLLEDRVITKSGQIKDVAIRASKITIEGKEVMQGIFRDITELKKIEELLAEKKKLQEFSTEVGSLWINRTGINAVLQASTEAIVAHLDATFARIWVLNREENVLELKASAGMYTHLDGAHGRVPVGKFKIGLIAEERKPLLTNTVVGDPRVHDQEWARREGMVSFAGYPLIADGQLLGVMAMFSRHHLSDFTLNALEVVADKVAVGISRNQIEEALQQSEEKFRGLYESSRDALMTLEPPSWAFTSGNLATVAMFRAKNEEDFIAHAPWQLSPERQPDGRASDEKAREMIETAMREGSHFFEWTHKRIDGEDFPATVLLTRMELAGRRFLQATVRDITLYRQAEESVERLNHQNEIILNAAGEGIFGLDIHGNHTFMNPSAAQMLGYTVDELIHINSHRTCHYKKADGSPYSEEECPIYEAYKDGKVHQIADDIFWRKDGTSFPVEYTSTPIIEDGKLSGAVVTFRDITKRRQAEKTLFDSEEYIKTIMAAIQAGVIVIDVEKHTITDINMAAENLIGDKREAIIGKECHKYICPAEKGKCPITDLNQLVDRSERVLINAKGKKIPILKTVVPLTIKGQKYLIESFIDITERKRMEEELKRLSVTDNLTQAYNRTKYEEVIKREIERTKRSSNPLSIAMFDIDHFKKVNDTYGHAVGDYVLKTLYQIAKKNIRYIDYIVRWGGEEFIVIALDTDLRGAAMMAEKIRKAIEDYNFDKVGRITVSFGVTQFKQDDTEDSFMKRADDALYKAKENGRNKVEVVL